VLAPSPPVAATADHQVIEGLLIRCAADGIPGVTVHGFRNVTVRNVAIQHSVAGPGLVFVEANGLTIVNVTVRLVTATTGGPLPNAGAVGISGASTESLRLDRVRTVGGSSGIYLLGCPGARLTNVQGSDMRGPFPRGQCVQFDKCPNAVLDTFSCVNRVGTNASWTEDNISVYQSNNVTVRNGLIDGNNSPSGDGVMFESGGSRVTGQTITAGRVEDVDTVHQGNGCFGAWAASGVVFHNVRASRTHCTGMDGRGKPLSGALVFSGGSEGSPPVASRGLQIINGTYSELCANNLVWPGRAFAATQLQAGNFTPRSSLNLVFCWEYAL